MALLDESGPNATPMAGALRDGLEVLALNQVVTFQQYTRVVLPVDGFVFWSPTGITQNFKGSLHYAQEIIQSEDETQGLATVQFTSEQQITLFADAPINSLFIAEVAGFRFAFSQQQGVYTASGPLWHYFGRSIQPAFASQILGPGNTIDPEQAVTTNSLALWLKLNNYASPFYDGFTNVGVPFFQSPIQLFPSHMMPANLVPPYGSIHIGDNDTEALQAIPEVDSMRNHYQLCSDNVRITLYGVQHDLALDFVDTVNQYSLETDNFGIMNMPVLRDAIRTAPELQTRAAKKIIDYRVSYQQTRVANVARQLIKSCVPTFIFESTPL